MDEDFAATLRHQLRDTARTLTADEVLRVWNGTSWTNVCSILSGLGQTDVGFVLEVTDEDREVSAEIVRKALGYSYAALVAEARGRGIVVPPVDPVEFFARNRSNLSSARGSSDRRVATPIDQVLDVLRWKILAAVLLRRYEADPAERLNQDGFVSLMREVGLGR